MHMAASSASASTAARPSAAGRPQSFRTIAISLTLALGIIGAAWVVGGRQGFSEIGTGGANQQLLPRVGEPAPPFRALLLNGNVIDSSAFAGVPVWINFWASWCAPCRAELPEMKAAAAELSDRGMLVVAISLDETTDDAATYATQQNVREFVVLSDPDRVGTSSGYGVNNFPTHIFVDATGIVRSVVLAPMSAEEAIANAEKAINPAG